MYADGLRLLIFGAFLTVCQGSILKMATPQGVRV